MSESDDVEEAAIEDVGPGPIRNYIAHDAEGNIILIGTGTTVSVMQTVATYQESLGMKLVVRFDIKASLSQRLDLSTEPPTIHAKEE